IELVRRELGVTGEIVKLASNEGQFGPMAAALDAIARAAADGNRYPDGGCYELRHALGERFEVDPECVVIANGADAIISHLSLSLLDPGDEIACCWPSFPLYVINATKMGAVSRFAPLDGSSYDLDALLDVIGPRTKLVYVCSPNNPSG